MKHLLTLTIVLLFAGTQSVKSQDSPFSWKVEAGINYSNSTEKTDPLDKKCPIVPRIDLGVDYRLTDYFYLQSGITYSMKGLKSEGKGEMGGVAVDGSVKLWQHVLQIPVFAVYKMDVSQNVRLGLGAGPYFAYGFAGKTKAEGVVGGQAFSKESDTFGKDKLLKRFDFGLGFKLSSEINKHYLIGLSYELGLTDIGNMNILGGEISYKNRIAALTIGYIF